MNDYIPSDDLLERLDALDIRIYALTSGKTIIGEYSSHTDIDTIELAMPAIMLQDDVSEYGVSFHEAIPGNSFEPIDICTNIIEYSSKATLLIKKLYRDYLTIARFDQIITEHIDDAPIDLYHLVPKGLSDDYWKRVASRLKP